MEANGGATNLKRKGKLGYGTKSFALRSASHAPVRGPRKMESDSDPQGPNFNSSTTSGDAQLPQALQLGGAFTVKMLIFFDFENFVKFCHFRALLY